jgi:hypothetical protein
MADQDPDPQEDLSLVPAFLRRSTGRRGPARRSTAPVEEPAGGPTPSRLDPASLPMPLSRRRLALVAAGLVMTLVLVGFGREVSDAAAASDRAAQLRDTNAALRSELADLQGDLGNIGDGPYIGIAARGYGLGAKHEIPVVLAAGAPTLPPNAPGSASVRVGAPPVSGSPLDAWLDLLFGAGR